MYIKDLNNTVGFITMLGICRLAYDLNIFNVDAPCVGDFCVGFVPPRVVFDLNMIALMFNTSSVMIIA